MAFQDGTLRVLITKPKIGAWGLNWQHCHDVVTFVSHSFEQDYQAIRRCWRFGQEHSVQVHRIATRGEARVLANLERKQRQADEMYDSLIREMSKAQARQDRADTVPMTIPSWLGQPARGAA